MKSLVRLAGRIAMPTAIAALFSSPLTPALAQTQGGTETVTVYTTGELLTKFCRAFLAARRADWHVDGNTSLNAGECYAYVTSVADVLQIESDRITVSQHLPKSCVPKGIAGDDLAVMVANYLDRKPELRSLGAYFLIRQAFAEKFPCK
ncbi:Rap1a/Tai family immunity protein [Rhizobium sp. RAF56]|uniref:Rap1a/Tai family immunity protein n=1 Tax=Rhizobium sp. RAF56 TaxID=3233062 RepID=UPI003F94CFB4